jgi:hypothetical protein
VVKRRQKPGPAKPARPENRPETPTAWPAERHSGEGSASALDTLQKLEKRRVASLPAEPHKD